LTSKYNGGIPWFVDPNAASGSVRALVSCKKLLPDGVTVAFPEGKDPVSVFMAHKGTVAIKDYLNFKGGQLSGPAATWLPGGQKVFVGQYAHNELDGLCCLFRNDAVCLVVDCRQGAVQAVHLVSANRVTQTFDDPQQARNNQVAGEMLREFDRADSDLKAEKKSFQEYIKNLRQRLASELSLIRRKEMSVRDRQRAAADAKAWNNFIQHATGR
jgi:hypothetical protein